MLRADRVAGKGVNIVPAEPIDVGAALSLTPGEALRRVLDQGVAWLAESDLVMITLLADVLRLVAELRDDPRARPADLTNALKLAASLAGDLGFSPAARSKLGLAEVRAASKLEELRARNRGPG